MRAIQQWFIRMLHVGYQKPHHKRNEDRNDEKEISVLSLMGS